MASFDFPSSGLTDGQTHTENGITFVWDSTNGAWKKFPASATAGPPGPPGSDSTVAGPPGPPSTTPGPPGPPGTTGVSNYQSFTSSNTWTKPSQGNFVFVYMWAGGGGGGQAGYKKGGGGAGGYAEYQIPMSALPSSVSVTVGTGGGPGIDGGYSRFYNNNYIVYGGGRGAATNNSTDEQILAGGGGVGNIFGTGGTNIGGGSGSYDDSGGFNGYNTLNSQGPGVGGNAFDVGSSNASFNNAAKGGDNVYTGGGGGARRDAYGVANAPGGTSRLAGNGGAGGSNGSAPAGGGGGGASGGSGEVRVVVV